MESSLTARETQEALEERISRGLYLRGERLPPVRSIAAELGTSPSTVSRALQEMVRSGWLEIQERQFVRVRKELPSKAVRSADIERVVKGLAHKWKLWGGEEQELLSIIRDYIREAFESDVQFVFTECNRDDLDRMAEQVAGVVQNVPIARALIHDLDTAKLREERSVILVPYYHYAEVKEIVGEDVPVVPVHSTPSVETLDALITIPAEARVLVVGHNARSIARLSALVRDYAEANVTGITLQETTKLAALAPAADIVVAVQAATAALAAVSDLPRVITVHFTVESSLRGKLMMAETHLGA